MRFLVLVLVFGCLSCGDTEDGGFIVTPHGYRVRFIDQGTVSTGMMTLDDVYMRLATQIGYIEDSSLRTMAFGVAFDIIDNHSFVATDGVTWASGQWLPWCNTVKVSLYGQQVGSVVPQDAPPWTVRTSWRDPSLQVWGIMPPYLPALEHELGHAVYGPMAGH